MAFHEEVCRLSYLSVEIEETGTMKPNRDVGKIVWSIFPEQERKGFQHLSMKNLQG